MSKELKERIEELERENKYLKEILDKKKSSNIVNKHKVLLDDDDLWITKNHKVYMDNEYPVIWVKDKRYYIHNLVMPPDKGKVIDHINNNPMDNRKENLRQATQQQNTWNQKLSVKNTSGLKGVTKRRDRNKYYAAIVYNRQKLPLGYFETAEEAHLIYCFAILFFFGEFANPGY